MLSLFKIRGECEPDRRMAEIIQERRSGRTGEITETRKTAKNGKTQEEQQAAERVGKAPEGEPGAKDRDRSAKKSESLSRGKECPSKRDWARAIEELRQEGHPLEYMLQRIGMARSVFYYHLKRLSISDGHDETRRRIKELYDNSHGRYGYRRICYDLRNEGLVINHKTVQKLMSQMGIKAKVKKRRYCSYKGEIGKVAPNIIDRDFAADRPNQKWATDVTQVCIHDEKMYLSPILDMYNGEIVTYTISRSPDLKMVTDMLRSAFDSHANLDGLVMHSDQGWHYQHGLFQKMLADNGIIQSMSRKGNCLDNAMMENFFGLMKNELLYVNDFDSIDDFIAQLNEYIWWYNNKRIKLRLNGMSPVQYRAHTL